MSSGTSFNPEKMLDGLSQYCQNVQTYLSQLENASSGSIDLGQMFKLQYQMQVMSQYIEAVSNVLSSINTEMITMARATKGG